MLSTIIEIFSHFSLFQLIISIFGVALFLFGLIIHGQDATKRRGKFFLFFTSILLWWGITIASLGGAPPSMTHAILVMLYLSSGATLLVSFLFFDVPMIKGSPTSFLHYLAVFAPSISITFAILSPGFIVKDVLVYDNIKIGFFSGKWHILYVLYQIIFLSSIIWVLLKKYRLSAGIFKLQARDMLAVFAISAAIFVGLIFLYPGFSGIYDIFLFGYISVATLALGIGFVLIKYNFWSMEIIAVKSLAIVMVSVLLVNFFFLNSPLWIVFNAILTTTIVVAGFLLVENTRIETESRDRIARLFYEINEKRDRVALLGRKKSEFFTIASHPLRDPLTAIKGYSSMVIDGSFGEAPPLVLDAVIKVFESSKHLISIISDFMNISNIESGDIKYIFKDINMEELIISTANDMRLSAKHAGSTLNVIIDEKYDNYFVIADKSKMQLVISSLLDNAIKYAPRAEITILLSKNPDKSKIILSVSDTGIGIDKNTMGKIFKKFSRTDDINKTYTEGLGLGLYVAQEIVSAHKGHIWAVSEGEGTGATFYVELNAKKA